MSSAGSTKRRITASGHLGQFACCPFFEVPGEREVGLPTLPDEGAQPDTSPALQTVPLAVDKPVGQRMGREIRDGVEGGVGVLAQFADVPVAQAGNVLVERAQSRASRLSGSIASGCGSASTANRSGSNCGREMAQVCRALR